MKPNDPPQPPIHVPMVNAPPKPRSILDVAKAHRANPPAPSMPQSAQKPISRPPQAVKTMKGTRNGPAPIGYELVEAKCGHAAPLALFPDAKDKYRKERRLKVQNKPCDACIAEAALAAMKTAKAARKAKREAAGREPWRNEAAGYLGRLPDGARFDVQYSDELKQWTGVLTIPGAEPIRGAASGVYRLLAVLDRQWRGVPFDTPTDPNAVPGANLGVQPAVPVAPKVTP